MHIPLNRPWIRAIVNTRRLTVDHLHHATLAAQPVRKLEATGNHVAGSGARRCRLVGLGCPTGRIQEVASRMERIDGTGISVIWDAVERVHVEALLRDGAAFTIGEVVGVADEVLQVALGLPS